MKTVVHRHLRFTMRNNLVADCEGCRVATTIEIISPSAIMSLENSRKVIRQLRLASKPRHDRSETSAVTTAWGVNWNEEFIARDIMQNFYDANRKQLDQVRVTARNGTVSISAPAGYELERLFYLGSDKESDDVGKYGEGFKVAATCLLRDHGVAPVAVSGTQILCMRIADEPVKGTKYYPLVYDYFVSDKPHDGTKLILPACSRKLIASLEVGMDHFLYDGNKLVGETRWSLGNEFALYDSRNENGHVFYRNLKRGEIPGLSIVLVINKEYKSIENKIANDRDRNAFGGDLMKLFYRTFAKNMKYSIDANRTIVEAARECWERGHPLLSEIAEAAGYRSTVFGQATAIQIFGDKYFARSKASDSNDELSYRRLEQEWEKQGRRALPGYFEKFGVTSAKLHYHEIEAKARQESLKRDSRVPTLAEQSGIELLTEILGQLAPVIIQVVKGRTQYTVGETEAVLGELKSGRSYRSREVYLAARVFVADFAEALAVFLHEHAHVFGYDGSREFTDALTELLETTIRHREQLEEFESRWKAAKQQVMKERRTHRSKEKGPIEHQLEGMDESELRKLLSDVPPVVLKRLLSSREAKR